MQLAAYQRLAAREAGLFFAALDEDAREPCDLLEREDGAIRQERMVGAEHLARHAVDAAEIAAIGHRDAKVVHRARARIDERPAGERRRRGACRIAPNFQGNDLLHRAVSLGEIITDAV